jgi:hypothetical protein
METDPPPEEASRSSVSSLKSRFEQLATRETRSGPEERTSSATSTVSRPSSSDKSRNLSEEHLSIRRSVEGTCNSRYILIHI